MDTNELLLVKDNLHKLCEEVGAYQMAQFGRRNLKTKSKSTQIDLVTEVDIKSEEIIVAYIKAHFSEHNILAEESGEADKASDYTWIIDPVDGTINYAHGYPLFAISIGLKYEEDMILGCIYLPVFKSFYWAINGYGAYCNEDKISVSKESNLNYAVLATGFPYDKKTNANNNLDYFSNIMPSLAGVRRSGSACVDLVHVAHGKLDGYFEMYLNQWDFMPGSLIIKEAGGKVKYQKNQKGYSIVATNSNIHDNLIDKLYEIRKEDY